MTDKTKIRILTGLMILSFLCITVLGYQVWTLSSYKLESKRPIVDNMLSQTLPNMQPKNIDTWMSPWGNNDRFSALHEQMNQMMNQMVPGGSIFSHGGFGLSNSSPTVSIEDSDDAYIVSVSVPEGQEITFDTKVENETLTVSGIVKAKSESQSNGVLNHGSSVSQFSKSLTLTDAIDEVGITIEQKDDQFIVHVPKKS